VNEFKLLKKKNENRVTSFGWAVRLVLPLPSARSVSPTQHELALSGNNCIGARVIGTVALPPATDCNGRYLRGEIRLVHDG
jgi:hypothetical protein